ncbi:MAG: helix-turn-helix transcriptional regulator [Solirubrobacteraceae bacterium]
MAQAIDQDTARELRLFGRNVCKVREQVGPKQIDLATLAKLDRSAISQIECARRAPKFSTLLKITRAAQIKPAELFEGVGHKESPAEKPVHTGKTPSSPAKLFGANLKWARKYRGLTKEQLALDATVDRSTIGAIERGEIEPSLPKLLKLARALEIPPALLLHNVE